MKRFCLFILISLLLSGCIFLKQKFQHPETKDEKICSTWGFGWLGVPAALGMFFQCKEDLKEAGYIGVDWNKEKVKKIP